MPPPPPVAGSSSSSSLLDRKPSLPVPSLPALAAVSSASVFLANLFTYSAAMPKMIILPHADFKANKVAERLPGMFCTRALGHAWDMSDSKF